jgi:hypothetical protein
MIEHFHVQIGLKAEPLRLFASLFLKNAILLLYIQFLLNFRMGVKRDDRIVMREPGGKVDGPSD